jgi:hypothetical protein
MNNTGSQIANLITKNGKTGADMTHALKELGGGDMQRGLTKIAEFFLADSAHSLKIGRIQGAVGGAAGVGAIFLLYKFVKSAVKNSKHIEEGKVILNCLEKNLPEKKIDDPKESTIEVTEVSVQA